MLSQELIEPGDAQVKFFRILGELFQCAWVFRDEQVCSTPSGILQPGAGQFFGDIRLGEL